MIYKAEGYYGVEDYARLCGTTVRAIRARIKARTVHYVKMDFFYLVNAQLSPPVKKLNPHRLPKPTIVSAPPFSFDGLREVGVYSRGKHFSEGIIYEAIITGKLDGYVIGDKVFIKPEDAEQFYKS